MSANLTQQRLEQAFAASGLTQAELSRLSGIDRGSISLYLSGKYRPKADKLIRLAGALGVSAEWLSGAEEATNEAAVPFPVLSGPELTPTGETLLVPRSALQGLSGDEFFVLAYTGLSMYPRLLEGDKLLVRRTQTVPDAAIIVVVQEGALLIRQKQEGLLVPSNPELPPRTLTPGTRILGRAVQLIRSL